MRPALLFSQILNMNVGFFGIQYSFGLQQSKMSPIYKYLGADEVTLPLLAGALLICAAIATLFVRVVRAPNPEKLAVV
jgi:hypothetical protein